LGNILYVYDSSDRVFTVDLTSGDMSHIGSRTSIWSGLEFGPDGLLYASGMYLYVLDPVDGHTLYQIGDRLASFLGNLSSWPAPALFQMDFPSRYIWTIDPATAVTLAELPVGSTGLVCFVPELATAATAPTVQAESRATTVGQGRTLEDLLKLELLESWGYTVQMISHEATQAEYDSAFGMQDVIYVSSTVDPIIIGSKLDNASIAVVSESGDLNTNLGFALAHSQPVGHRIELTDNLHLITGLFPAEPISIYDADMEGLAVSSTLSPDLKLLALWGTSGTLAVLERGAALAGGGIAAGPRVMLPFGDVDWRHVSNAGLLILQRSLDWGIVTATESTSCNGSYRDEFNTISYSGSDGTLTWTTDWLEMGDSGDAASGDVQVMSDISDMRLMIKNKSRSVEREADLSGAGTATLTFDYRRSRLDDPADRVRIEVSGDGGGSWSTLENFRGPDNDAAYITTSYDISSFIASNTRIRFVSSSYLGKQDDVYFDNIQITCTP